MAWAPLKLKLRGWGYSSPQSPTARPSPRLPRLSFSCGCRGCSAGCGATAARLAVSLALISSIVLVAMTFDVSNLEGLLLWVKENKLQGSLLFLLLYTLAIVLMVPAMVMAMCAGAIFGVLAGVVIVWLGSTVGQVLAFVVGRYLLRDMVLRFLTQQYPKWGAIDRALEREGWKLVTLLRLSPIAPWNVLNYALAVTAVPLGPYALSSSLAVLPYLVMFVYFGSLARTLSDIFGGLAGPDPTTTLLLGGISGVLMVAIVWYTTNMAKNAIKEALVEEGDAAVAEEGGEMDVLCMLRGGAMDSAAGDPDGVELAEGGNLRHGAHDALLLPHSMHHVAGGGMRSPHAGGVAATVRVVGAGGGVGSGRATPTADRGLSPLRQRPEVQLIPLVAKEVVLTPRGETHGGDALLGGAEGLQHTRGGAGSGGKGLSKGPSRGASRPVSPRSGPVPGW